MARDGKIIDTLQLVDGDQNPVTVKIRMYTGSGGTKFWATYPSAPKVETELTERLDSVDLVRTAAREAVKKFKAVEWSNKLLVCVSGTPWGDNKNRHSSQQHGRMYVPKTNRDWNQRNLDGVEVKLEIEVDCYQVGELLGKPVHRRVKRHSWDRDQVHEGLPYRHHFHDAEGVNALVDDTPENRHALNTIFEMIQKLDEKLKEFLGPENAQKTLALVTKGQPLQLTGPSNEPSPRTPVRGGKKAARQGPR